MDYELLLKKIVLTDDTITVNYSDEIARFVNLAISHFKLDRFVEFNNKNEMIIIHR